MAEMVRAAPVARRRLPHPRRQRRCLVEPVGVQQLPEAAAHHRDVLAEELRHPRRLCREAVPGQQAQQRRPDFPHHGCHRRLVQQRLDRGATRLLAGERPAGFAQPGQVAMELPILQPAGLRHQCGQDAHQQQCIGVPLPPLGQQRIGGQGGDAFQHRQRRVLVQKGAQPLHRRLGLPVQEFLHRTQQTGQGLAQLRLGSAPALRIPVAGLQQLAEQGAVARLVLLRPLAQGQRHGYAADLLAQGGEVVVQLGMDAVPAGHPLQHRAAEQGGDGIRRFRGADDQHVMRMARSPAARRQEDGLRQGGRRRHLSLLRRQHIRPEQHDRGEAPSAPLLLRPLEPHRAPQLVEHAQAVVVALAAGEIEVEGFVLDIQRHAREPAAQALRLDLPRPGGGAGGEIGEALAEAVAQAARQREAGLAPEHA
ncbi:hypothetical protein MVG78_11750 [Roseomonas gilardii subsp. gilardii]|uniref:hypothetical protein n=1 Tax=Roseomonas gilardii TaxID=257708 RepID=UPI001FFA3540|nr:hypothetical protein [Roseomonas gilardii]UPG71267.1 hypothetical protein MVG78_11750 [Roseomonas gilardii subsp. gilardii]